MTVHEGRVVRWDGEQQVAAVAVEGIGAEVVVPLSALPRPLEPGELVDLDLEHVGDHWQVRAATPTDG